jgi:long-chain acyl-CoA synthetase
VTPAPGSTTSTSAQTPTSQLSTSEPAAGAVNIARWVVDRAASDPNLPAVQQGDAIITYSALNDASARFATVLAERGVRAGDRVAMIMPNVVYFPVVYYAILRLGAVVVPMNPLLKAGEVGYTFDDAEVRVAVAFPLVAGEAEKAVQDRNVDLLVTVPEEFEALLAATEPTASVAAVDADTTAVILYTSGTTGSPKGAELTHANLASNVATTLETLLPMAPGDVVFGGLPLFHSFGQTVGMNAALAGGACLSLLPKFDGEEALRVVERDRVTVFLGVPTMYMALLAVPERERFDTSTLTTAASGGASLPVEVLREVEQAFGFTLLEGYGLSETSPVASFNHPGAVRKPGTIGTPIRGVEFALRDAEDREVSGEIGEIVIRGENVMKGYWRRPDATAEAVRDGWFHTGDLATRDDEGYYTIVDRVKDMIIRNGFNIYPREVEEVLYAHPAVAEAAVFGVPDPAHGEEVAALVKLKDGAQASADELRDWVKERIAGYKYPRHIRFGDLPKGPTGKIVKREITFTEEGTGQSR